MSRISVLIIALGAVVLSGTAAAETTFQVEFKHNPRAPAEDNYVSFERTARKACAVDIKEAGGVLNKKQLERACSARLMNDMVDATNDLAISALHAERTGLPAIAIASRD